MASSTRPAPDHSQRGPQAPDRPQHPEGGEQQADETGENGQGRALRDGADEATLLQILKRVGEQFGPAHHRSGRGGNGEIIAQSLRRCADYNDLAGQKLRRNLSGEDRGCGDRAIAPRRPQLQRTKFGRMHIVSAAEFFVQSQRQMRHRCTIRHGQGGNDAADDAIVVGLDADVACDQG